MTKKSGYGHPPTHSRFKPGKSGNPKGRPKGSKNFNTMLDALLAQTIAVTERGRRRRLPAVEVLLKRTLASALQGDAKSAQQIFHLLANYGGAGEDNSTTPTVVRDSEVIQRAIERAMREAQKE
jgi:hypothetical protein